MSSTSVGTMPILRRAASRLQGATSAIIATVRIGVALPNYGPLASPDVLARLAALAEARGADGVWVSDHLVAPVGSRSVYPYDRRPDPQPGQLGVIEEFYEALVTLAFLAGQTRRVRLGVSAYVLPCRNPVVTAKQVATLDALSGGRVVLAIGVGWLREEFAALDAPFAGRGQRTDEYLAVCRALWAGGTASHAGPSYRLPPVRTGPRPAQRPHPPIWVAGNSDAALARAARHGDGWHGIDLAPDELAARVARLRAACAAERRQPGAVGVTLRRSAPLDVLARELDAYRAAGVDDLVVGLPRGGSADDAARALEDVLALSTR
jgi:probable F420-dependent oxidoreductase